MHAMDVFLELGHVLLLAPAYVAPQRVRQVLLQTPQFGLRGERANVSSTLTAVQHKL